MRLRIMGAGRIPVVACILLIHVCIGIQPVHSASLPIIVLDPGHGGRDAGYKGTGGTLEKNVTLVLCQQMAGMPAHEFKVHLTRTDDYALDLVSRTSMANHQEAAVFISIHAGGGFSHGFAGMSIFHIGSDSKPGQGTISKGPMPHETEPRLEAWDRIQQKHEAESSRLGALVRHYFLLRKITSNVEMQHGPIRVLKGADMPAILIETGFLADAARERAFHDPANQKAFAASIRDAVKEFLLSPR